MARNTIDFGIDLGTTNSEIAVVEKGQLQVIKNGFREEITPSAVRIDRKGSTIVGKLAFNQRVEDKENTHTQFKRLMGSQQVLDFPASGKRMKPEELSAEVLKSLRQDVQREMGEDFSAAVITIPALFEIPQCDATRRAAEAAGITCSPLLQEPIAAALAYGLQADTLDGFLLVYDLGGGTFDASLIRTVEGRLRVIDHAGDNFLGGKDFDDALLGYLLTKLQREFGLPALNAATDRKAIAKLLLEAENAKIQLSSTANAYISIAGLGRGLDEFEASFELARSEYESLIEPFVRKTIGICNDLLSTNNLTSSAISRVVLVGGPTLTPFVRTSVEGSLGIKPEFKVDPMTIVARGAALFSASQRVPRTASTPVPTGTLRLKLVYGPVSQDTETDVAGKLEETGEFANARIEITRMDGGWASGKLPLRNGAFMIPVVLNSRSVNDFQIRLYDPTGNSLRIDPDAFSITQGRMVEDAPLSRSIRLGFSNASTHVLIQKGTTVPCQGRSKRGDIVTTHEVIRGEQRDVLNIPLLQGENSRSDRNREIATLRVAGNEIARTLPAGSDVEIVVDVDRDFKVKVTAFVPFLNQSFTLISGNTLAPLPRVEDMQADLAAEKQRLALLKEIKDGSVNSANQHQVNEATLTVNALEEQIGKAKDKDADAAEHARRGIEELKARIDLIEESGKWPALLKRFEEAKQVATETVQDSNIANDGERLASLISQGNSSIEKRDQLRLEKSISLLDSLTWEIWARQDDFWVASFHNVAKFATRFIDKVRGGSLLEEGSLAIERGDFASLRSIVRELWGLVPDSDGTSKEKMQFPSSLRKRTVGYL